MSDRLAIIIKISLCVGILAFYAWCMVWVVRDARKGKPCESLAPFRVWLTGPIGLMLWLAFRPPHAESNE